MNKETLLTEILRSSPIRYLSSKDLNDAVQDGEFLGALKNDLKLDDATLQELAEDLAGDVPYGAVLTLGDQVLVLQDAPCLEGSHLMPCHKATAKDADGKLYEVTWPVPCEDFADVHEVDWENFKVGKIND